MWEPRIGLPLLPLSTRASTASCSILFSFLIIISGAWRSSRCFNLLFLLITLLYKSLRSEVANLPPSNWTIGCNSGGRTGNIVKTIHSGLFPLFLKLSITLSLFIAFFLLCPDVCLISSISSSVAFSRSNSCNIFRIASAPISATKTGPNLSLNSLYFASVRRSITSKDSRSWIVSSVFVCSSSMNSAYIVFTISSNFSGFLASVFFTLISSLSSSSRYSFDSSTASNLVFISSIFCSASCLKKLIASSFSLLLISVTIYWAKYKTLSKFLGETSKRSPSLEGVLFENQMWATGAANFMCPILSLLTLALVTSTPHRSQITPLYRIFLYFPQ